MTARQAATVHPSHNETPLRGLPGRGWRSAFSGWLLRCAVVDSGFHCVKGDAGLEPNGNLSIGLGGECVPAFGFAAGLAVLLRETVVGMNLDTEFFSRKDDFNKKRRAGAGGVGAKECVRVLVEEGAK